MARKTNVTPPLEIQSPEFQKAWAEWIDHLRDKCGKLTEKQLAIHAQKCVALGSVKAVAAIQYSIERAYRAIFTPPVELKQEVAKAMNERIVHDGQKYRDDAEKHKATFEAECEASETLLREFGTAVREFAAGLVSPFGGPMPVNWENRPMLRNWVALKWRERT